MSRILMTAGLMLLAATVKAQVPGSGAALLVPADSRASRDSDVESLKLKVDQLQQALDRQNQLLLEMQRRLDELQGKSGAPSRAPEEVSLRATPIEVAAKTTDATAVKQTRPEDKPPILAGWDGTRAFLRSPDGNFETQIGGYAQLDGRSYQSGNHPPNTFLVRRARLALEGRVYKYYEFRVEGDFADTASTLLRDFYLNVHRIDEVQLRFGQFRVPYSQEEIRSDAYQDFVERSLVNNLVPSRSPGIAIQGSINKGTFEYQLGAFNGKGLLATNTNGTPETALRVRFSPWRSGQSFWTKGLSVGGAITQGRNLEGLSVRGQTESRSFTFFVPDSVNGKYYRANGELTWMLGPAAIRVEYDQTNQRRDNLGTGGTNLPGVVAKGYTGQITYLLTGETKPEAGALTPKRNVFWDGSGESGFGAWELKFRYSNLQIADGTSKSNRAETFFFGPNWYLNRFVRYVMDFGFERFKDPLRTPNPGDRTFFVLLNRIQVAF
ncbi:MAG TPA: porin [Blastocatellia bacterium]|nr:porin [Blastocatellia bacterium]